MLEKQMASQIANAMDTIGVATVVGKVLLSS